MAATFVPSRVSNIHIRVNVGAGWGSAGAAMKSSSETAKWNWTRHVGSAAVVWSVLACGAWVFAQDGGPDSDSGGDSTPAVAGQPAARAVRLSSVDGQVQISQGTEVLASQALANTPLFEGTQITTAEDGRAEVQFEDGSVARISPNSSLTLGTLRQQGGTMQTDLILNSGLGYFEIQNSGQPNTIRVHFGNDVATASGFTVLRVNLDYPPGEVAVFSGNVHVDGGSALALDLHGGESVKLNGTEPGNYVVAETIEPDSWDTWNSDRDQALTAQEADQTSATSSMPQSGNPAWSDLNSNGNWYNVPGQGYVWSPYAATSADWDPYGCGSWMWTPRFGYIWVSCESWGYMPYAFGTWSFYDGFGWGWAPGVGIPWWGGGGWGFNLGAKPVRYRPPHRPPGGPHGGPIHFGGRYQPYPVLSVNRVRYAQGRRAAASAQCAGDHCGEHGRAAASVAVAAGVWEWLCRWRHDACACCDGWRAHRGAVWSGDATCGAARKSRRVERTGAHERDASALQHLSAAGECLSSADERLSRASADVSSTDTVDAESSDADGRRRWASGGRRWGRWSAAVGWRWRSSLMDV